MPNPFQIGDKVRFLPSPRSKTYVTGTVSAVEVRNPRSQLGTWLVVACDDGKSRKVTPSRTSPL